MKTRILHSSRVAVCLFVVAASQATAGRSDSENSGLPAATESEVRDALQRMFSRVRFLGDKESSRLMLPENIAPDEAATVLGTIREIRELLRTPAEEPMSELSPPILVVRAISMDSSDRATACAYLVRAGSVTTVRLAAYNVTVAKKKQVWRLTSVSSDGSCQSVNDDPLLGVYPTPLILEGNKR